MKGNRNFFIIGLISIVGAIGYGIVFPIVYIYSQKFGLSDFQNGLLFSVFSICQFASTPIIGRMSDKYGRRPLLIVSLIGTAISFIMMAFAPNGFFLFLARALDGITAGNFSVAAAVISDTTTEENRAKGFGIIGAAFNFGFVFGPAISGLTYGINAALPFLIAAAITIVSVTITALMLPETNKHMGETQHGKLFDFGAMYKFLFDKQVGLTLLISLIFFFAFSLFIYSFNPFSVKVLGLNATQISLIFVLFGALGVLVQSTLVGKAVKRFGLKNTFSYGLLGTAIGFIGMFASHTVFIFILASVIVAFANGFVSPLIQTILSEETDAKSQGSIMGMNASYQSIGQILGPIAGGAIAMIAIQFPFLGGGLFTLLCFYLSLSVFKHKLHKESAF